MSNQKIKRVDISLKMFALLKKEDKNEKNLLHLGRDRYSLCHRKFSLDANPRIHFSLDIYRVLCVDGNHRNYYAYRHFRPLIIIVAEKQSPFKDKNLAGFFYFPTIL